MSAFAMQRLFTPETLTGDEEGLPENSVNGLEGDPQARPCSAGDVGGGGGGCVDVSTSTFGSTGV
jgi:hypothetical protein